MRLLHVIAAVATAAGARKILDAALLTVSAHDGALPTVLAHGMGDTCFNPGFASLVDDVAKYTRAPAFCFGVKGDPVATLTTTMAEQSREFAEFVASKPELSKGFNAIGLSQGNLLLRAYIQEQNDPPLKNWISVHGPLGGVSSIPRCDPDVSAVGISALGCELVDALVGTLAYSAIAQNAIAELNFYRDPFRLEEYVSTRNWVARLNCEVKGACTKNSRARVSKTSSITLIKALKDTMIFPKESEWFGGLTERSYDEVFSGADSPFFRDSGFASVRAVHYETTTGDHLQFSLKQLQDWMARAF